MNGRGLPHFAFIDGAGQAAKVGMPAAAAMLGHGELFLIAAVLTGDAFGRIWHVRAADDVYATICLGALALILSYSSLEFGNSSRDLISLRTITPKHLYPSIGAFAASLIAAYSAVRMED